ncbi:MAG: hypothetical protein K0R13_863 [Propionibacteriaceae bacterium]|jgi:hypothetical protein|nr:hypothetical protein [Propionibacteriaceae bacterium]
MNTEQDADPDLHDQPPDIDTTNVGTADGDPDIDIEPLQRSQDALDQAREAAREAFKDNPPDADPTEPPEPDS